MKKEILKYESPMVEVLDVEVERGFAISSVPGDTILPGSWSDGNNTINPGSWTEGIPGWK